MLFLQVSHRVLSEIQEENHLSEIEGGYKGYPQRFVQMEGSRNNRGTSHARPYTYASVDPTEDERFKLHGVLEGEKCNDDI